MGNVFLYILNTSITASFIALVVLLLRMILKKAPKWIICLFWAIVAVKLVIPINLESPISLLPQKEVISLDKLKTNENPGNIDAYLYDSSIENNSANYNEYNSDVQTQIIAGGTDTSLNQSQANESASERNNSEKYNNEKQHTTVNNGILNYEFILNLAATIWLMGIGVMLSYSIISYIRLKKRISTATPVFANVKQSENIKTPFVFGIIKPQIYVPGNIAKETLGFVLAHEKAHIDRKDYMTKPFAFLLLSIYWFNPILWLSYVMLCRDIEYACDEKVIKNLAKENRQRYSMALLENSVKRHLVSSCPVAFGEVGVKSRINKIMNYKQPKFWIIVVSFVLCIIVSVCFLTNPAKALDTKKQPDDSENVTQSDDEETDLITLDINVKTVINESFGIEFKLPEAYSLANNTTSDGSAYISPVAYEAQGGLTPISPIQTGYIKVIDNTGFTYEDDKLTGGFPLFNHGSFSEVQYIGGDSWQSLLVHWNMDMYTAVQLDELKKQGIDIKDETTDYWYIYFVNREENKAFYIALAANRFTKEQALELAKTVTVIYPDIHNEPDIADINSSKATSIDFTSPVTAGMTRYNYIDKNYVLETEKGTYRSSCLNKYIGIDFSDSGYIPIGTIGNVTSDEISADELQKIGLKNGTKVYEYVGNSPYYTRWLVTPVSDTEAYFWEKG